jgi:hypothetical protein
MLIAKLKCFSFSIFHMSTENITCKIPKIEGDCNFIQVYTKKDNRYHFAFSRVKKTSHILHGFLELNEIPIEYANRDEKTLLYETDDYLFMGAGTAVKTKIGIVLHPYENFKPNHVHAHEYKKQANYRKDIFVLYI